MKLCYCLVILGCLATFGFTSPSGKKLLSFPTLVSILKAKNATRPLSAPSSSLDKSPVQPQVPVFAPEMQPTAIIVPPPHAHPVHAATEIGQVESPTSLTGIKYNHICAPISKETDIQITKLCDTNGRKGANMHKGEETLIGSRGSCLKRFCVTIIPGDDDAGVDDLENTFGNSETAVYTECTAVNNLFKILVKSAVTPKCFDCSK